MNGKASELYSWGPLKVKNDVCLLQKKSSELPENCIPPNTLPYHEIVYGNSDQLKLPYHLSNNVHDM